MYFTLCHHSLLTFFTVVKWRVFQFFTFSSFQPNINEEKLKVINISYFRWGLVASLVTFLLRAKIRLWEMRIVINNTKHFFKYKKKKNLIFKIAKFKYNSSFIVIYYISKHMIVINNEVKIILLSLRIINSIQLYIWIYLKNLICCIEWTISKIYPG